MCDGRMRCNGGIDLSRDVSEKLAKSSTALRTPTWIESEGFDIKPEMNDGGQRSIRTSRDERVMADLWSFGDIFFIDAIAVKIESVLK